MKVAVDFDHVLFDTYGFYDELPTDTGAFKDTYQEVYERHDAYLLEEHVKLLNDDPRVTRHVTEDDVTGAYRQAPQYLRDDGLKALSEAFDVVIVTRETHTGWQRKKIHECGAEQYADEVIVVSGSPEDAPKHVPGAQVLIDDAEREHVYSGTAGILFDETTDSLADIVDEVLVLADGGQQPGSG